MEIKRVGTQPSAKGPLDWFTGAVRIDPLFQAPKIVQQAVATILNQIYEEDFLGFSYGFRPGRSQHDALDALSYALLKKKVNYVLDADPGSNVRDHRLGHIREFQRRVRCFHRQP